MKNEIDKDKNIPLMKNIEKCSDKISKNLNSIISKQRRG
jgi:hypothetical protein